VTRVSTFMPTGSALQRVAARSILAFTAAAATMAICLASTAAEARGYHHHHHWRYRPLVVRGPGLIPGTYPSNFGQPGYGCTTSLLAGNFGGCGTGWAYDGGPGWGYR
jgi:hypothetical protein